MLIPLEIQHGVLSPSAVCVDQSNRDTRTGHPEGDGVIHHQRNIERSGRVEIERMNDAIDYHDGQVVPGQDDVGREVVEDGAIKPIELLGRVKGIGAQQHIFELYVAWVSS